MVVCGAGGLRKNCHVLGGGNDEKREIWAAFWKEGGDDGSRKRGEEWNGREKAER